MSEIQYEIRPTPTGGCGYDECPQYDGKRCRLTGFRPQGCEPAYERLKAEVEAARAPGPHDEAIEKLVRALVDEALALCGARYPLHRNGLASCPTWPALLSEVRAARSPGDASASVEDGADDEAPTLDTVISDMERALYRQASHYEYRSALAAFLPRLKAARRLAPAAAPRENATEREECRGAPVHCEEHEGRHPFDPVTCVGAVYDFGPDRAAVLEDAARAVEETEVVEVGSGYLRADDAHATLADAARAVRALAAPAASTPPTKENDRG